LINQLNKKEKNNMPTVNAEGFSVAQPKLSKAPDGTLVSQYLINDVVCPTVFFQDWDAKSAAAYRSIIKDMEFIIHACELAVQPLESTEPSYEIEPGIDVKHLRVSDPQVIMLRALYLSCTVTYAKAFSQAYGRRLKLDESAVFSDLEQKQIHRRVMADRHDYVAHAGNNKHEAASTVLVLSPFERREIIDGPFSHATFSQAPHKQEFHELQSIAGSILNYCSNKEQKCIQKVKLRIRDFDIEKLYELAEIAPNRTLPSRK
jgi:hypothetical protein